jgi:hypothetical protein
MKNSLAYYKKAYTLNEVDNAVRFDVPINAQHEFYTDFADVRGDFEDRMIYKALNVNPKTFVFDARSNPFNKQTLFLAGMRGSGKTSEIAKYVGNLHKPDCFFCVVCNLDDQENGLDLNNMEYMDILIFQLERLFEELGTVGTYLETSIIEDMQRWFTERVEEVNKVIKREGGFEVEIRAETPSILSFLGIATKLKANLMGSKENAEKIRAVFKNNFTEFAKKINTFFEFVNKTLRNNNQAQELLFIIDGLEKTASMDIRRKIIIEENERFKQIKAYTIFTLPIELMSLTQKLYATGNQVISFPFVKLQERNGVLLDKAIKRFTQFVYKRIDEKLFESPELVQKVILMSGGSPRELLRILEFAAMYADDDKGLIDQEAVEKGIKKLAAQTSQYLNENDLKVLKQLKENNDKGLQTPFNESFQSLMENMIVMEYNDGNYKRVHPIVAESQLYKQYVG